MPRVEARPERGPPYADFATYFDRRGWSPHPHQIEARDAYRAGANGLIVQGTGAGKTLAALWGPIEAIVQRPTDRGVRLLYISPLRSLARDLTGRIAELIQGIGADLRVEQRSGDTSSSARQKQRLNPPEILVTTVESLGLLLCDPDAARVFENLECVVVDEWHAYLGEKRAVQLSLYVTRLKRLSAAARVWGLSATVADPELAFAKLVPVSAPEPTAIVASAAVKEIRCRVLRPPDVNGGLPWAGFFGLRLGDTLLEELNPAVPSLIFVNTRAQAELWYQYLVAARPEWRRQIALHHGSLSLGERETIEEGMLAGRITLCVCTSSLELGIDFPAIERVFHVGSPKGVSRLLQRAGRSNHTARGSPDLTVLAVNLPELVEIEAAIAAAKNGRVESAPDEGPCWDVLVQHLVTCALGGGFYADAMYEELRDCPYFSRLERARFDELLKVAETGGQSLANYPGYRRIGLADGGRYLVQSKKVGLLHRMNLSTIPSTTSVELRFELGGKPLGYVEEGFAARLKKGDTFVFSGRTLEFTRMKDFKVYVKLNRAPTERTLHWQGTRLPFSPLLGEQLRAEVEGLRTLATEAETQPTQSRVWAAIQARRSAIPARGELLVERIRFKRGTLLVYYLFEGQETHEGIGALLAWRLMRRKPGSYRVIANDWAVAIAADTGGALDEIDPFELLGGDELEQDFEGALNLHELARRKFRDIARVSGLVYQNLPQRERAARQLQASAGLLFDLFLRYESSHPLVVQAFEEVRRRELDLPRLGAALERARSLKPLICECRRVTPFAFPAYVQRKSQVHSNESMEERIEKLQRELFA